jgi:hypothetical protein
MPLQYQGLFIGKLAMLDENSIMITQSEFISSCNLMELDVSGITSTANDIARRTTTHEGLLYTERRLQLSVEFHTGLFMKMEQKKDYSGL